MGLGQIPISHASVLLGQQVDHHLGPRLDDWSKHDFLDVTEHATLNDGDCFAELIVRGP